MYEIFDKIFNKARVFGPIILIISTIITLWKNKKYSFYYKFGTISSFILNFILKNIFRQPRPNENMEKFNLTMKHFNMFSFKNGIPYDIFGMPSGHSQFVSFSTMYIYLVRKNLYITLIYLLISLIVIYESIKLEYHSVSQVIVGSMVGSLYAIFIYYLAQNNIMGDISLKKDDNALM